MAHVVHLVTLALRLCILGFMHSELCPAQLPLTIDAQAPSPPILNAWLAWRSWLLSAQIGRLAIHRLRLRKRTWLAT